MANKNRVKSRKSKRTTSRKRNTRRNYKTGGGELYQIIDSVSNLRAEEFGEEKEDAANKMFQNKLSKFKTSLSKINNLMLLNKFLGQIDAKRKSKPKNNDIFQLADLETALDERISSVERYGKMNDRTMDQETAREIYGNNYDEPKDY